ncbi:preprotein translocase subunit SecG [Caulobacter sp. KR2-114]|uniref:preprotein translocase subunit SecG n=1 Tax=Caulobacter sp. KR2-114 TaxID=3400912 RepID=UPI003BFFC959
MLYGLLLTLNVLVCAALVGVVLMQRSEGGALGAGGGPAGLVTARGAGDLLTRTTWILFALFLSLSLALTLIGAHDRSNQAIVNRLKLGPAAPLTTPGATPAPTGAPIAPLTPIAPGAQPGGLAPPALPSAPIAAPVAPTAIPAPAAHPEAVRPQPASKPQAAAKPEAAKPEAAKPEAARPAAPKPAKPAHSAAAASPAAAPEAPPVITPPPPKADSDAAKTPTP